MLNSMTFEYIGHVGAAEVKSSNDKDRAELRIAATERWKDRNDQEHEKTSWFTIVSFADHIVNAVKSKQLAKGRYYRFNGDITMSEYEKDGETRYSPNFQLRRFDHLDRKPE
mgnify:CR=1 FL=1